MVGSMIAGAEDYFFLVCWFACAGFVDNVGWV